MESSLRIALLSKLQQVGLGERADDYMQVFTDSVDMQSTLDLHQELFQETLEYMEKHVLEYAIELPGSSTRWVPVEFIKFIYSDEKNLRFRILRFVGKLTAADYREEEEDTIFDLDVGNIGTKFLSWDMTLAFMLQDSKTTELKEKNPKESEFVPEPEGDEEQMLSDQEEASLALVLLKGQDAEEEPDEDIDAEKTMELLPETDVTCLCPIILQGKEYLYLDDIAKSLGLREDEALSILHNACGMEDEAGPSSLAPSFGIDFEDHELTKSLAFRSYNSENTLPETVAKALVAIKEEENWYHSVPESLFQRSKPLTATKAEDTGGSIDIASEKRIQMDEDFLVSETNCLVYIYNTLIVGYLLMLCIVGCLPY